MIDRKFMNYRRNFKKYLDDLGKRKPSPGGGSAVCISVCLGLSLIEKSINYSLDKEGMLRIKDSKFSGKRYLMRAASLRRKIYDYIDLDGQIFDKVMKCKGKDREKALKMSEKLIVDVAKACVKVFFLAKEIESGIKKSISSDFYIGLEFIKTALFGCVTNLDANTSIFGRSNKYIDSFKKSLEKWQRF